MASKLDEIISQLPVEVRLVVREYALIFVEMTNENIFQWVELALQSPDVAILYLEAVQQTPSENISNLYELAHRVGELNLKHTERRQETRRFIRLIISAGLLMLQSQLQDE